MDTWHFPRELASWIDRMSCLLDEAQRLLQRCVRCWLGRCLP